MSAPISVVVPAHNAKRFIGEAIASIYAQTLPVSELIVVDDGSTDDTARAAEFAITNLKPRGHDPMVRLRRQDKRGVAAARNAGIREASGDWIAFLDADDVWGVDKIEQQWQMICRYPTAGIVACDHSAFNDRDSVPALPAASSHPRSGRLVSSIDHEFFVSGLSLLPSTVIVRRKAFDTAGLFNESLHAIEDFECFMRILAHYPLAVVDHSLVRYRLHDRNVHFDEALMQRSFLQYVELVRANPKNYPGAAVQAALGGRAAGSSAGGPVRGMG